MHSLTTEHQAKVRQIQKDLQQFAQAGRQVKMYHGSTNSTRPPVNAELAYVDVSGLTDILEINVSEGYVLAEPNVPLDMLVKATTAKGLVPPVVAEFPGITVGGAVQGGSAESSSHNYGLFSNICFEYEVILGNGDTVTCSASENTDLFHGLPCAFGSLGILTAVKLRLVPAAPYVNVRYVPTKEYANTLKTMKLSVELGHEFVDAIQFSSSSGVVVEGDYSQNQTNRLARFSNFWNEWFYLHVEKCVTNNIREETVPLVDYLFRYDRGAFWVAKYGFNETIVPFNRLTRFIFAWVFKTRTLFKLMHSSGYAYKYLAQDICLPQETVLDFLHFNDKVTDIYPFWLCPLKPTKTDKLAPTAITTDFVINIGLWGEPKKSNASFRAVNRDIELEVKKLGGRKVLYAHTYYSEEEFWEIYDKKWYDYLRDQYHASIVFPNVFQKTTTRDSPFKPSIFRGAIGLFKSPYKS